MLRTRKTYSMLDQAKGGAGSSQFGGLQALSAEQLAALEGEVVYCLPPPGPLQLTIPLPPNRAQAPAGAPQQTDRCYSGPGGRWGV